MKENKKSFIQEFKEFAIKGNALDLAIGVIIGGAFGAIINSLVNDILMPLLSLLIGTVNFENLSFVKKFTGLDGKEASLVLPYGKFIQAVFNFLIIALCIFLLVKGINKAKSKMTKPHEEEEKAPVKSNQEIVLEEIRDELKKMNK